MKHYEIHWTALDPTLGTEMARTRPAVIVCPLTTGVHPAWRSRVQVRCGGRPAEVAVDQIRAVSKRRLGRKIGSLNDDQAAELRRVITEMYGE